MYWTVVTTKPMAHKKATDNLSRQGFEFYAPKFEEVSIRRGSRFVSDKLLFPGYIFIFVVDRWRSLLGTFGISSVLLSGENPARVPTQWIEDLKKSESERGVVVLSRGRFKKGQQVTVSSGPFSGFSGLYEGMDASRREIVLLSLFSRWTKVDVAAESLSAA